MLVRFSDPSKLTCHHSLVFLSSLDDVFRSVFHEVFRVARDGLHTGKATPLP
jgi:hypothetical protein